MKNLKDYNENKEKYGVILRQNEQFLIQNNHGTNPSINNQLNSADLKLTDDTKQDYTATMTHSKDYLKHTVFQDSKIVLKTGPHNTRGT